MTQYIDKDALVAEIKASIKGIEVSQKAGLIKKRDANKKIFLFKSILSFLDTLEVKEEFKIGETQIYLEDGGGEPPYDGKQWLDLSCTEYEIPEDKFKDGDKVELIIRKAQKGE